MAKTLVTGASGFIGSHVARALAARGDDLRLLVRRGSGVDHLDGVDFERVTGDITDRRAVRRAMKGVERVFHVAGTTSMRSGDRERVFDVNVGGTRNVLEEAMRAGVEQVVHTSSAGAVGPARPGGTADENQAFTAGHFGIAYINSKHEAEVEALRAAARGLAGDRRQPDLRPRSRRPQRHLQRPGQAGDAAPDPLLRRRWAERRRRARRRQRATCSPRARESRGSATCSVAATSRSTRLFADIGRISGVPPPPIKVPPNLTIAAIGAARRIGLPAPSPPTRCARPSTGGPTARPRPARSSASSRAPTRRRSRTRCAGRPSRLGDRLGGAPRSDIALRAFGRVLQLGERVGLG